MNWERLLDRIGIFWFPFLVGLVLLVAWSPLHAKGVAVLRDQGITVILTDEPCKLPGVSNLPYRLTWTDKDKTYEGCFSIHSGIVVTYTDDKAVGLIPGQLFKPLTES
jgi:hypothetical protein